MRDGEASEDLEHFRVAWNVRSRSVFESVFRGTDPCTNALSSSMKRRCLVYPVWYKLDESEFEALRRAALGQGEISALISVTEEFGSNLDGSLAHHFEIPLQFECYRSIRQIGILENALYSPTGRWGMLFSAEQHALIGGDASFIESIFRVHPDWRTSEKAFVRDWRAKSLDSQIDIRWVDALVATLDCR